MASARSRLTATSSVPWTLALHYPGIQQLPIAGGGFGGILSRYVSISIRLLNSIGANYPELVFEGRYLGIEHGVIHEKAMAIQYGWLVGAGVLIANVLSVDFGERHILPLHRSSR